MISTKKIGPVAYVLVGLFTGALYVGFDVISEAKLVSGTLTGVQASLHAVVDRLFPILTGAFVGLCLYQLNLRKRLSAAEQAANRAEALHMRLLKVERDQAIWVLTAAVLHELNNPLHALGLLLDEQANTLNTDPRHANLTERARAQVKRALGHLRALRSMRNVGEPEVERVSLNAIIAALAEEIRALAEADGIAVALECADSVEACADPIYVRTILENLVDNSLHSLRAGGGRLTIQLEKSEDHAIVSVKDDGPPLAADMRATLFDPLRSTKTQGLGLGLPIARALARAMRGELVLDESGQKAFRLQLPLEARP